ncbi:hypothetical protein N0V93_005729 [Gnomoniopsis smithogilvyi]|uniref:Carboxylic ester hydrolase n=1 Tax=Gnomoniopsis smithogilvyi TaxID=1191159 RepID=A0A9W8YTD0_9PEZI|nr:hypothetical protein N0V93_005729 [Gnomoniopsis smithogilvyi]
MAIHYVLRVFALMAALTIATPSPQSINADLTILMNNDLLGASSPYLDSAVILLSSRSYEDAVAGCEALSEELWSPENARVSIQTNLDYLVYEGKATKDSQFWVASAGNGTRAISASGDLSTVDESLALPALCTQSAPLATAAETDNNTSDWQVSVRSNNEELIGFRDRTSFRFYGVRYAPQPERFTYSELYTGSNTTVDATSFGSECAQGSNTGSEDCFFLNIWTPYLPNPDSGSGNSSLKPVLFWIHGGAFTGGTGSDNTFDGGSLASRADVVVVTINYRLSTLGFLALNDGVTNGNYGIADQITALDWVIANIKDFGGDASRITIFGQSAGAGSVRAMMASPKALGKFAGAIPQSNLGGLYFGTTYSEYYTIQEELEVAGNAILAAANCTNATSQVDCLRELPTFSLLSLGTTTQYIVQDGTYITSDHLQLDGYKAPYKLLMGTMREDAAALIGFPSTSNETAYFSANGWAEPPADLFPIPNGTNQTLDLYNMTSIFQTDAEFRCIDEATVYSGLQNGVWDEVYYYEFERSYQLINFPNYDVCEPPVTADHPNGDPSLPYFKCHSGDLYEVFGNIVFQNLPLRDEYDLPFEQLVVDTWSSFARTFDPNPDPAFLEARGYSNTTQILEQKGDWSPATKGNLTLRALAWPPYQDNFRDLDQCAGIDLPLTYYQ